MMKTAKILLSLILVMLLTFPVWAEEIPKDSNLEMQTAGDGIQKDKITIPDTSLSAEDDSEAGSSQEIDNTETEAASVPAVKLSIDNKNTYDGMSSAYKNGYTPTIADGKAIIILPLTADGDIKEDRVTAEVDLGNTEKSPFVYKSYQKSFRLSEEPVNGTSEKNKIFYIRFDLSLASDRYNGVYPVTIHVTAKDGAGNAVDQSFTCYVTIKDGTDSNAVNEPAGAPSAEQEAVPTSSPVVLVTGCEISPKNVEAGSEFQAVVTLKNTSTIKSVQNMVVTVTEPSADFTLKNDSNTIYIDKLGRDDTTEVTLDFAVSQNTAEGKYKVILDMSYDDPDAVALTSNGGFDVTVIQPLNVQMSVPVIASTVNAGDTITVDFQIMNLGRSSIYNVRCDISGFGLLPVNLAFIGDMEAGSEGKASMDLFIGTKDMSEDYTGSEKYGDTAGTITLIYEDMFGEEYTQTYAFQTTIEAPAAAVVQNDEEEEQPALQWWISVLILGGIVLLAGTAVGAYFFGKKQR